MLSFQTMQKVIPLNRSIQFYACTILVTNFFEFILIILSIRFVSSFTQISSNLQSIASIKSHKYQLLNDAKKINIVPFNQNIRTILCYYLFFVVIQFLNQSIDICLKNPKTNRIKKLRQCTQTDSIKACKNTYKKSVSGAKIVLPSNPRKHMCKVSSRQYGLDDQIGRYLGGYN